MVGLVGGALAPTNNQSRQPPTHSQSTIKRRKTYDAPITTPTAGADMNNMPEAPHIDLPEGWTFKPSEPESFEEWFDAKCTAVHEYNEGLRR